MTGYILVQLILQPPLPHVATTNLILASGDVVTWGDGPGPLIVPGRCFPLGLKVAWRNTVAPQGLLSQAGTNHPRNDHFQWFSMKNMTKLPIVQVVPS